MSSTNLVLIISAMDKELKYLKERLHAQAVDKRRYQGELEGHEIHLLCTGIGYQATKMRLEAYLLQQRPKLILHQGIAGALNEELPMFTTICGPITNGMKTIYPNGALQEKVKAIGMEKGSFREGVMLSVDEFIQDDTKRDAYREKTGALSVDMESIMVAELANQHKIPFVAYRTISDFARKDSWNMAIHNGKKASYIVSKLTWELIKQI